MRLRWFTPVFLCTLAFADPPGASVKVAVTVPSAYAFGIFAQPQSLTVPPGFQISVWARLEGARFMAIAANGDVFISQPGGGSVYVYRPILGSEPKQFKYVSGLTSPHGLAFDTVGGVTYLYVAESNQIDRFIYNAGDTSSHDRQIIVKGLPDGNLPEFAAGYAHPLKNLAIGPDHLLYVGLGSSCNVCVSDPVADPVRGSIYVYNMDGTGGRPFARGLRNAEGLAFVPGSNTLWAAVNNRDQLPYPYQDSTNQYDQIVTTYVDDHPPEPFTKVTDGANYGWPFCNPTQDGPSGFDNMKFDRDLDTNLDGHVNCSLMSPISRGFQAHSAPLQLTFAQNTNFPQIYRNGAIVAFHGSWDRTVPTGYKVAYLPWNSLTGQPGPQVDLVAGLRDIGSRPAGIAILPDGSLLISDDASGTIFRLSYSPSVVSGADAYAVISPDSFATVYGAALSPQTAQAAPPYPVSLGGTSLPITDAAGNTFQASLTYVSPTQINFVVPAALAAGVAMVGAKNWPVMVQPAAPALFSLDGSGTGTAAATAVDSAGNSVPVFTLKPSLVETPIEVTGPVKYLTLYGTGLRSIATGSMHVTVNGIAVNVVFSGAQPSYPGLDQINIQLPPALAGTGKAQIQAVSDGWLSNTVTITIL